jgi:hypothetical protein
VQKRKRKNTHKAKNPSIPGECQKHTDQTPYHLQVAWILKPLEKDPDLNPRRAEEESQQIKRKKKNRGQTWLIKA